MKRIMFALLLGAVIWILFSPPILADGGNRIRNVISIHDPTLEEHPWSELDSPASIQRPANAYNIGDQQGKKIETTNTMLGMAFYYFIKIRTLSFHLIATGAR